MKTKPFLPDWSLAERVDHPPGPALPARVLSADFIHQALRQTPNQAVVATQPREGREPCAVGLRPAAVLILITPGGILLTRRPDHLRHHAGQMSLPGGACEPDDCSPIETACRETREEIGVSPDRYRVLGELPTLPTRSGFCIHPVVAWAEEQPMLAPDPSEVDSIFMVPLDHALNPSRHHCYRWRMPQSAEDPQHPPENFETWTLDWDGPLVWGATASLIRCLYSTVARALTLPVA